LKSQLRKISQMLKEVSQQHGPESEVIQSLKQHESELTKQINENKHKLKAYQHHENWTKIIEYARQRGTPLSSALEKTLYPMAQKMIEPLGLYYPFQISYYASWLFETFGESTVTKLKKDLTTRKEKPLTVDERITTRDETRDRVAKRRKVVANKNPLKMDVPNLLKHLKSLTGKIGGADQSIEAFKIVYHTDLEQLDDNDLDGQIKHDITIYCKGQQLVLWNAYCMGHELEVAKQRAAAKKVKWNEYLMLVVGNVISESYANKHINFFSLCKKYPAFRHTAAPISWVIDRVDMIRNYLDDHPEESAYWEKEPGDFVITGGDAMEVDENNS